MSRFVNTDAQTLHTLIQESRVIERHALPDHTLTFAQHPLLGGLVCMDSCQNDPYYLLTEKEVATD